MPSFGQKGHVSHAPLYYGGYSEEEAEVPEALQQVVGWPVASRERHLGQVGGLAVDSKGRVVVFHRAERRWDSRSFVGDKMSQSLGPIKDDVLLTLLPESGEILSTFGAGQFYMPHGLTVDGEDNLWLTDVGLHQVMKIPRDSTTPSLVLGTKLEPGNDVSHFCKPTDVAVASNGDFFVADGYCNGRVMKFAAPNGTFLAQWGHESTTGMSPPGEDEFLVPHSLALIESRDLLCVADREHARIQCFDAGLNGTRPGQFRKSFMPNRGTIYAIEYDPNGDVLYVVNGHGMDDIIEGFTLDLDGNILETWGPQRKTFDEPHDVTVSRDGINVYVGDIGTQPTVYKFDRPILHSVDPQLQTLG
ncbi:AMDB-like protein [Mya arenaria]|uniref:peptidylamidoglycolate lyase n=1 Tax=Mya arenaria TaxID=6604 RepID=A0ABY7FDL1_MYAAR|nr:AMDB-like protein [Mya arenaria]